MPCTSCRSVKQQDFLSEIMIHFPGKQGFKKPTVLVFPRLRVCMDCGVTQFTIGDSELMQLKDSDFHAQLRKCRSA